MAGQGCATDPARAVGVSPGLIKRRPGQPAAAVGMRQDPDLMRAILRATVEAEGFPPSVPTVDGFTPAQVKHHVWLLGQQGLVSVTNIDADMSPNFEALLLGASALSEAALRAMDDATVMARITKAAGAFSIDLLKAAVLGALLG